MTTTPTRWKAQSQVNTTDGGTSQGNGQVAGTAGGGYFVVWSDNSTGQNEIVGRRYDAAGNPVGGEVRPLSPASGEGHYLDIAAMTGGGLAVAAVDLDFPDPDHDVVVSIRTPTLALGRNDFIDTGAQNTIDPAITVFADNSYAVAYTVLVSVNEWDVVGRIVSPTGVVGAQFDILNETDRSGNAELATLTNGNFAAVFESEFNGNAADNDVLYRIFSPAGAPLTGPIFIPGGAGFGVGESDPKVAALAGGGFVVAWTDNAGDASGLGIRAAVIGANGAPITGNILVNVVSQVGNQREASVTALADGGFFVTWDDAVANLVRGQRFDPAGNLVGSEVAIKNGVGGPEVALLSDGRIAFAVGDINPDTDVTTTIFDPRTTEIDNASVASIVGNATADYLLQRDAGGVRNLLAFQIDDHSVTTTFDVGAIGVDWKIDGADDFDADGDGDILMHRDIGSARTYTIERMGPGGVEAAVPIGTIGNEWFAVGTGDFNNDGDGDVLLHKDAGGTRTLLILDLQNNVVQAGLVAGAVGTDWQVDGVGDFDNDGDSDIVMHQDVGATRNLTIFEMQNSGVVGTSSLGALGNDWQIDGIGDFDADGDADILMRRDAPTRNLTVLEIEDNTVLAGHSLGNVADNVWIDGVGDFDLDGDADVALHFDSGAVRNYLTLESQGFDVVAVHTIAAVGGDFVVA